MRAEIRCRFLARHQYRTVSVTADWNVLRVALWSELQHVCTEHLTSVGKGRHTRGDVHAYDVDNPLLVEFRNLR